MSPSISAGRRRPASEERRRSPGRRTPWWCCGHDRGADSAAPAVRWLLLPAALLLIFAFALPLALFFAQAFHAYSNGKVGADWTLATLNAFLTDPFHLETLYNSFYLAAIVTIICLLIAYPIALVMIRRRGTVLFTFLGIVIFSPVLVSIIVRAYGWQLLLANNGVVNSILLELGLVDRPVRLMFNWLGVIVSMVHVELPFMLFPLLTVLMQLPRGLVEAGHDLGATEFQVWRRIVLPLSLPGVLAGCQVVFSTAISAFASPTVLGGGRVRVMPVTIYQSVVGLDWPMGAAQSIVLLLFSLVLVAVFSAPPRNSAIAGGPVMRPLAARWLVNAYVALFVLFMLAPLVFVIVNSFNQARFEHLPPHPASRSSGMSGCSRSPISSSRCATRLSWRR